MRARNDPWDKPWVTIAAVVGIIAVVIVAIVFFMGSGNNGGQTPSPAQTQAPSGSSTVPVTGINPETIKDVPTVTIPATGAFVKVSYIGAFSGIFGINGEVVRAQDSGERLYPLNATEGTVSATFHKDDASRHEITVEIYKNGKALQIGRNSSAYGEVKVFSQV